MLWGKGVGLVIFGRVRMKLYVDLELKTPFLVSFKMMLLLGRGSVRAIGRDLISMRVW